jgi:hypothetical protein
MFTSGYGNLLPACPKLFSLMEMDQRRLSDLASEVRLDVGT